MARRLVHQGRVPFRTTVALGVLAASGLLMAGAAHGQSVSYTFSPTSGPAGTTISFEGSGCYPDDNPDRSDGRFEVFASVGAGVSSGSLLTGGTFNSNADGSFSASTSRAVPDDAALGEHQTQVSCSSGRSVGGTFEVTAAVQQEEEPATVVEIVPATTSSTIATASVPLARTGPAHPTGLARAALALLLLGVALLGTAPRRKA